MRMLVKCLNCGIRWERVTSEYDGETIERTEDLMYNCPACGSNAYRIDKEVKDEKMPKV